MIQRLSAALRLWGNLSPAWQTALWLLLFLLLSRMLYLPSSRTIEGSEDETFTASPNTSLVLEGVDARGVAATMIVRSFSSITLESESASLSPRYRDMLQGFGVNLTGPTDAPQSLHWNVNLVGPTGRFRLEILPESGASLSIGTADGLILLGSDAPLGLSPYPEFVGETGSIGGRLSLGGQLVEAPPDILAQFTIRPGPGGQQAQADIERPESTDLRFGDALSRSRGLAIRSVAQRDRAGNTMRRICGAPGGQHLWSVLFAPSLEPQPPAGDCAPGFLTASSLALSGNSVSVDLSGTAYVAGASQWLEKLRGNIVLWPVLAALIAIPGQRLLKGLLALFARKEVKE